MKLRDIVEASIEDAIKMSKLDAEAAYEKARQFDLEKHFDSSLGADKKDTSLGEEDNDNQHVDNQQASRYVDSALSKVNANNSVDSEAIIDKFNIIRSGHSMNDKDISSAIQKYMDTLSSEQKQAIFNVLAAIGKIVQNQVDPTRYTKPPEEPSAIQNARLQMLQRKSAENDKTDHVIKKQVEPIKSTPKEKVVSNDKIEQGSDEQTDEDENDKLVLPVRVKR